MVPEPVPASAPSTLLAEAALPASASEVPGQVMSEGASGSSGAGTKRPNDHSSNPEAKRFHADHSPRDVVMLLDDSDVNRTVEQCRVICRERESISCRRE